MLLKFMFIDFINSHWHDWHGTGRQEDRMLKPEWWERFFANWGIEIDQSLDPITHAKLIRLRDLLRVMVEKLTEKQPISDSNLAKLNEFLAVTPCITSVLRIEDGYELLDVPQRRDWNWIIREITLSFCKYLVSHDQRRIRICENKDCLWVFFDESRNRTRRWCDDSMCGNLLKVRRHRARNRMSQECNDHIE